MAELHWFPLYASDWLTSAAISAMLPEQEGAYLRLLIQAWGDGSEEPSLENDDRKLAAWSRLGRRWRALGAAVRAQFVEREGRLYNPKLSAVWREQQDKHHAAVAKATKAVRAREAKRAEKRRTSGQPAQPAHPETTSTASQPPQHDDLGDSDQKRNGASPRSSPDDRSIMQSELDTTVEPSLQRVLPVVAGSALRADGPLRAPGEPSNGNGARARPEVADFGVVLEQIDPDRALARRSKLQADKESAAAIAWCSELPEEARARIEARVDAEVAAARAQSERGRARIRDSVRMAAWR
ncbi:MAG TPA: DUF1376 domain-containing protein, partial [Stellaceae bacterium]|nr:DUF1376 domain-containing protein [Stellaceae bacterium]